MAKTHVNVSPMDLVVLESIGVADKPDPREQLAFFRINPSNGSMEPSGGTFGYTAPKGKALILTEVDWQYESGKSGANVTLRVFLTWDSLSLGKEIDRRVLESTILLGSTGGGGTSTDVTTGIVVPSGVKISVDVIGSGATGKIQHVLIRGYLVAV